MADTPTASPSLLSQLDIAAANKAVLASPLRVGVGGLSLKDLAATANLQPYEAFTLLKLRGRKKQATDLDKEIIASIKGRRTASPQYSGTRSNIETFNFNVQYYTEHPIGSHYSGDFNIGNAINATLGVLSFGTLPDLRSFFSGVGQGKFDLGKIQFNVPFSGAQVNKYTHDVVDFYSGQQFSKQATPYLDSNVAKLLDTIAGATAGAVTGYAAFNYGALTPAASLAPTTSQSPALIGVTQASLDAQPLFQIGEVANYSRAGVTAASLGEVGASGGGIVAGITQGLTTVGKFLGTTVATAYIGKIIVGGQKALGALLRGDVGQAVDDLVGGLDPTRTNRAVTGGGYGGGGGGGGYYGATGQQSSSILSTVLPIGMVLIAVLVGVYFYRRKK